MSAVPSSQHDDRNIVRRRSTIRRGFTVLELIAGVAILAIVLGTVAVAMRIQADDVRGSRDGAAREAGTARWGTRWRQELIEAENVSYAIESEPTDGSAILDSITFGMAGERTVRYRIEDGALVRENGDGVENDGRTAQDRLAMPGLKASRLERLLVAGTEQFAIVWEGTDVRRSEGPRHRSLGRRWLAARTAPPVDVPETMP